MRDCLLIITVAITFIFGYYIMGKLDRFLENSHHAAARYFQSGENRLRTGFSDPLTAESIADVPDKLTKTQEDVSVCFFSGRECGLLREFSRHKLDVLFLSENIADPERTHYNVGRVCLRYAPDWRK